MPRSVAWTFARTLLTPTSPRRFARTTKPTGAARTRDGAAQPDRFSECVGLAARPRARKQAVDHRGVHSCSLLDDPRGYKEALHRAPRTRRKSRIQNIWHRHRLRR